MGESPEYRPNGSVSSPTKNPTITQVIILISTSASSASQRSGKNRGGNLAIVLSGAPAGSSARLRYCKNWSRGYRGKLKSVENHPHLTGANAPIESAKAPAASALRAKRRGPKKSK
jgi:hypothetical protein